MHYINKYAQLFMRLALGTGFIFPILDRFGFLGPAGQQGVAWGNWQNFTAYTNSLMPFANPSFAAVASAVATLAELVFGVCLIFGFKTRIVALGSALLTCIFGISMAIFVSITAPIVYPVFIFTGGALLLSQVRKYEFSLDDIIS